MYRIRLVASSAICSIVVSFYDQTSLDRLLGRTTIFTYQESNTVSPYIFFPYLSRYRHYTKTPPPNDQKKML